MLLPEQREFEVASISGHEIEENTGIGVLRAEDIYRQTVSEVDDVDAVFISCMNYRKFDVIERLEADLGVPVVTPNRAMLWDALGHTSIDRTEAELGRLFDC